jgi:transposase
MSTTDRLGLDNGLEIAEADVVEINSSLWFVDSEGYRTVYYGWDSILYRIDLDDRAELRYVAVALRKSRLAKQQEIAVAFGVSETALRKWERAFDRDGMEGIRSKPRPGRPRKIGRLEETCVRRWFDEGLSHREMARRLGVSQPAVGTALKRLGLVTRTRDRGAEFSFDSSIVCEGPLAPIVEEHQSDAIDLEPPSSELTEENCETPSEVTPVASPEGSVVWVADPLDRSTDRVLAALGLLEDADPAFASGEGLRFVGALLAVPLLVASGALKAFEETYRSIGPAFYGLRTTVVCFFLLALLRIKRPENIKERDPQDLGRLLGLDRSPEVKTLRRKLTKLAGKRRGMDLMRRLAELRVAEQPEAIGTLFVDGHVSQYHGKFNISKGYITQRRLSTRAVTNTWVNDFNGDPLFVVESEANEGLTETLKPVLEEIRKIVGDREITVVFDRGGWSPKLFKDLIRSGFHIITYRKGSWPKYPEHRFEEHMVEVDGKEYSYRLFDQRKIRVGRNPDRKRDGRKYIWMRQVTRLRENGYQTGIVTDRQDLPPAMVAFAASKRWRQENYFKYGDEEFNLDGLLEYGTEPLEAERDRPNPARRELEKQLRQAEERLAAAERAAGSELAKNWTCEDPELDAIEADINSITEARLDVENLRSRIAAVPARVSCSDTVKLKSERRRIATCFKMIAYHAESKLLSQLFRVYRRCEDEGRTLLHAAFQSSGNIAVTQDELRITIAAQSSPHRTAAVQSLCEYINSLKASYPGTSLRMVFNVGQATEATATEVTHACQEV